MRGVGARTHWRDQPRQCSDSSHCLLHRAMAPAARCGPGPALAVALPALPWLPPSGLQQFSDQPGLALALHRPAQALGADDGTDVVQGGVEIIVDDDVVELLGMSDFTA